MKEYSFCRSPWTYEDIKKKNIWVYSTLGTFLMPCFHVQKAKFIIWTCTESNKIPISTISCIKSQLFWFTQHDKNGIYILIISILIILREHPFIVTFLVLCNFGSTFPHYLILFPHKPWERGLLQCLWGGGRDQVK